jgi:hypothetical protein
MRTRDFIPFEDVRLKSRIVSDSYPLTKICEMVRCEGGTRLRSPDQFRERKAISIPSRMIAEGIGLVRASGCP